MTTLEVPTAARGASGRSDRAVFRSFVDAEWIKLRTVRSTIYTLTAAAVTAIGLGAFACQRLAAELSGGSPPIGPDGRPNVVDNIPHSLVGAIAAQLAIGALGVIVVTSEFSTGMVRASLAAMPQRGRWIAAKVGVFGAVALVVGLVLSFVSFLTGQAILAPQNAGASLADPGALRSVILTGVYLALIGLLGAAFGLLVRHTAGALTSLLGLLFVLPAFAQALPTHLHFALLPYFPEQIGEQATTSYQLSNAFPAWGGVALLAGYVAVLTLAGVVAVSRRDA
jgi:hypothetical protein